MPRAVLRDGVIVPIDPLPAEWNDGQELWVEESGGPTTASLDQWRSELDALCAESDPAEDIQLQNVLNQLRQQGKDLMRRQAGLP
jgi:hypothetical protein